MPSLVEFRLTDVSVPGSGHLLFNYDRPVCKDNFEHVVNIYEKQGQFKEQSSV